MIKLETYDHIVLVVVNGQFTLEEVEEFARVVATKSEEKEDLYLIGIPVNMTGFPASVSDMIKAGKVLRGVQDHVKRIYGIQYHPIFSFIANVSTQVLRLKNNTIEAANIGDMYKVIEKEGDIFPNLKSSWAQHGDQIKASLAEFEHDVA